MGIHLFVIRSWYFLCIAFVGTLHVSIPLAIGTYYATRERDPFTMMMFVPLFFIVLAYLNVSAMRAVMRSWGHAGEPEFINMVKAVARHITLDTIFPLKLAFLASAAVALPLHYLVDRDFLIAGLFGVTGASEFAQAMDMAKLLLPVNAVIVANILTVLPYIYIVVLCLFGVSIASGAASASANPPGHLPIHGLGRKFWYIVATLAVNAVLVVGLAGTALFGAVWSLANGIEILPAIGFGVMGVVLVLGYFNAYVVFALAYCVDEDERKEEREVIRHLRKYGLPDETLDLRALRAQRMKGPPAASAEGA